MKTNDFIKPSRKGAGKLFIAISLIVLLTNPRIFSLLTARGYILPRVNGYEVFINDTPEPDALCFYHSFMLAGRIEKQLILWLPSQQAPNGRDILIIDLIKHTVGQSNDTSNDYELYIKKYLYRSANALGIIYFSNGAKSFGEKITVSKNNGYYFTLPKNYPNRPASKIAVRYLVSD